MKEAIKRKAMMGTLDELQISAGMQVPVRLITPIKADFRYRQMREERIPASNAVIFFARDCSGSMDDYRCEIVSDTCWWLDIWIRRFYKRVDRCYFVHDTEAEEVDEKKFYTYRMGGGTRCSSAFESVADQLKNRYPPERFNVYLFYFTDGQNAEGDTSKLIDIIAEKMGPNQVNLVGVTEVCAYDNQTVSAEIVDAIDSGKLKKKNMRMAYVGGAGNKPSSDEDRNQQVIKVIKTLLSPKEPV